MKIEQIIPFLDYTSLNQTDTPQTITRFTERMLDLYAKGMPTPAAVCVYPSMVESVGLALGASDISIAAVCGGFPAPQTYIEVKMLEVAMAIENGADEIDMVINVGAILEGDYEMASCEIETIVSEIEGDALLKVIIESGILADQQLIHQASMVAMQAGADFIKTSTGKSAIGATPEAVRTMCRAIKEYHAVTERAVGIKVAGGISTLEDAVAYYNIVSEELGEQWLVPELFRIGSSKLLENL